MLVKIITNSNQITVKGVKWIFSNPKLASIVIFLGIKEVTVIRMDRVILHRENVNYVDNRVTKHIVAENKQVSSRETPETLATTGPVVWGTEIRYTGKGCGR